MFLYIFVAIFLGASLYFYNKNPKYAVYFIVFLAPWHGLDVDIGLRVTAYLIALTPLVIIIYTQSIIGRSRHKGIVNLFYFFVSYMVIRSILQMLLLPDSTVVGGFFRTPAMRSFIQILMFFIIISPIFIIQRLIKNYSDLLIIGKIYVQSTILLAILGWVQIALWFSTGVNPLPIGFMNQLLGGVDQGTIREGIFMSGDSFIYRMNSLGGEPKDLGAGLVIGMLLIQIFLSSDLLQQAKRYQAKVVWVFLAVSAFATFSTMAYYMWIIGTVVIFSSKFLIGYRGFRLINSNKYKNKNFPIYLSGLFLSLSLIIYLMISDSFIYSLIYDRTVGREGRNIIEDFDEAIIAFFFDNPLQAIIGVGLGNIHLYAGKYLASDVFQYAGGGVFFAKSGYLKIISDLGLFGLILFFIWIILQYRLLKKSLSSEVNNQFNVLKATILLFGWIMFVEYLATIYISDQFFITLGIVCAAISLSRLKKTDANFRSRLDLHNRSLPSPTHGRGAVVEGSGFNA